MGIEHAGPLEGTQTSLSWEFIKNTSAGMRYIVITYVVFCYLTLTFFLSACTFQLIQ